MRNTRFYLWITVSLLALLVVAIGGNAHAAAIDDDSEQSLHDQETIRKSFTLPTGSRMLEVDNVTGTIEVTGSDTDQIQMVVNKTLKAVSKEKLELARKEVTLDITQEGGALKLYVNGPFRCQNCENCSHSREHEGYSVRMDFQLEVPSSIAVNLKTVNGGHMVVKDITGKYSVHNVNGAIEMENIAGSGSARTVNGSVKVRFRENPRENSDFGSINGSVELYFAHNLSADFRFKNLNGGIFTDFPMTSLPGHIPQAEQRDGKFIFHADRFTGGRVGSGGPEIKADNINGSIRVLERHD